MSNLYASSKIVNMFNDVMEDIESSLPDKFGFTNSVAEVAENGIHFDVEFECEDQYNRELKLKKSSSVDKMLAKINAITK